MPVRYNVVVVKRVNAQPDHVNSFNREPLKPGTARRVFHEAVEEEWERLSGFSHRHGMGSFPHVQLAGHDSKTSREFVTVRVEATNGRWADPHEFPKED